MEKIWRERKKKKKKIEEKCKRREFEQEPRVENKIETEIVKDWFTGPVSLPVTL